MQFRFSLSTLLLITALIAVGLAWYSDHLRLYKQLQHDTAQLEMDLQDLDTRYQYNTKTLKYFLDAQIQIEKRHMALLANQRALYESRRASPTHDYDLEEAIGLLKSAMERVYADERRQLDFHEHNNDSLK